MKICTGCKQPLPLSEFPIRNKRDPKPRSKCRRCTQESTAKYLNTLSPEVRETRLRQRKAVEKRQQLAKPDHYRTLAIKNKIRKIGLVTETEVILQAYREQKECSICRGTNNNQELCLDHCHETDTFRGLLCHQCNMALGMFKNSPVVTRMAAAYLQKKKTW